MKKRILTSFQLEVLKDIAEAGRFKYHQAKFDSEAKEEIKQLVDEGHINKETIRSKLGNKYSTFIYFSLSKKD